jgi:hypothetical protein
VEFFGEGGGGSEEEASTVALGFPHDVLSRPSTMAAVFGDTEVSRVGHESRPRDDVVWRD